MLSLHFLVVGRVQGVGFRKATEKTALSMKLTGWVKNTAQGHVEILVEGEEDTLKNFLIYCWQGPPMAKVEKVVMIESSPLREAVFKDFSIAE